MPCDVGVHIYAACKDLTEWRPSHLPHRRRAGRRAALPAREGLPPGGARRVPSYKVEGRRLFDRGEVAALARGPAGRRTSVSIRLRRWWRRSVPTRPQGASAATRCAFAITPRASARGCSRSTATPAPSSSTSSGGRRRGSSIRPPRALWRCGRRLARALRGRRGRAGAPPAALGAGDGGVPRIPGPAQRLAGRARPPAGGGGPDRGPRGARAEAGRDRPRDPQAHPARRRGAGTERGPGRLPAADRQAARARAALPHLGGGGGAPVMDARARARGSCRSRS